MFRRIVLAKYKYSKVDLQCLDQYGNCACGRDITVKMGKDNLLKALAELGYPCDMEIVNNIDNEEYPKEGTYILISKNRQILLDSDE